MTPTANCGPYHVRKWFLQIEDALANESGEAADGAPLRKIVIACALHNPYAGRFERDLSPFVDASVHLGREFGRRLLEAAAGTPLQSYGKACLVGTDGEYEHGNALLTTTFANPVRDAVGGGLAWVPSSGKRGAPGTPIDIPLAHKDALYVRSHYDTVTVVFGDAPSRDEIVIACAFATRGRLHARLGGLTADGIAARDGLR